MATIYRASDTQLGRDVAIKLLRPEYLRDPDFSSRFRQEAQAAAALNHPNVVSVFDYGEDPSRPVHRHGARRRRGPRVDPPRQRRRCRRARPRASRPTVARALAAAHARGIVHRDVKPGNVLIGRDGRVKVADFGIARAFAEAQMTLPGTTLGSVHYFSPEQARGEPATAASDIYRLGLVLYEMLTGAGRGRATAPRPSRWPGCRPRAGPAPSPARRCHRTSPRSRARRWRDPIDRFPSAASMADALETSLARRGRRRSTGLAARPEPEPGPHRRRRCRAAAVRGRPCPAARDRALEPERHAYPPDAYASGDDGPPSRRTGRSPRPRPRIEDDVDEGEEGTSPLVWLAGLGRSCCSPRSRSCLPAAVDPWRRTGGEGGRPGARGQAAGRCDAGGDGLGLKLESVDAPSDQPVGTIIDQQPAGRTRWSTRARPFE